MSNGKIQLQFIGQIWQEGRKYIGFAPQLQVASCGKTKDEAQKKLVEALEGFIETARDMGTLEDILKEAGFVFEKKQNNKWTAPELVSLERMTLVV